MIADVERVMSALTARRLATATRRRALSMMRLVFDYAIRDRRLSVNVARMVALPRGGTKREPHWLRPKHLGRLVMALPPLRQPVVLFLGTTGCRFSEMAALRVDDVVQAPHGLGVRVHPAATQSKRTSGAVFGPTKTHQTRAVPVPAALDEYVRPRVAFTAPGGHLFASTTGGMWTNTYFRARSGRMEAVQRTGVEGTTTHDLRHTAASLLIAAGADVKAVQVILRHSTAAMTMDLYGHLFTETTWQAMERLPVIPLVQVPRAIEPPPGPGTSTAGGASAPRGPGRTPGFPLPRRDGYGPPAMLWLGRLDCPSPSLSPHATKTQRTTVADPEGGTCWVEISLIHGAGRRGGHSPEQRLR